VHLSVYFPFKGVYFMCTEAILQCEPKWVFASGVLQIKTKH